MNEAARTAADLVNRGDVDLLAVVHGLLARVHDVVVACDGDGVVCFVNEAIVGTLGYSPDAVVGRHFSDFITEAETREAEAAIARWNDRRGRPQGSDIDVVAADGTVARFHYRALLGDDLFGPGSMIITLSSVDAGDRNADLVPALIDNADRVARIAAAFLDESSGNFGRVLGEAVRELSGLEWLTRVTVWTIDGPEIELSARWDAAFDAPTNNPPQRLRVDMSPMLSHLMSGQEVRLMVDADNQPEFDTERRAFAAAGTCSLVALPLVARSSVLGIIVLETTVDAMIDGAAHLATMRAAAAVIAAAMLRHRAEAELAYQARIDRTTGLSNRWAAQSDLDETLEGLAKGHSTGVGVVGLDLARFKLVNEALGHRSGDALLAEVADRLRSAAPAASQLSRLSADEFLICIPDIDSEQAVIDVGRRVLDVFSVPFEIGGSITSVGSRAGVLFVAAGDAPIPPAEEVLRRIATIVDHAKQSGRMIETVESSGDSQLQRLRRIGELEAALTKGQLVPYFQAEWDLGTQRVLGAEALVRWIHPELGLVGANEIIPLAESVGLIGRIGHHVLVEACRKASKWVDMVDGFVLRVNVSAEQLRSGDFTAEVADALMETAFPARALCLELTESTLLDDPARSRVQFSHLRDLGVGLAIDDFGTGYSSILQLKELPLSSIKIDQRFVAGIVDNPSDRAIVEVTLELARAFGVSATAEGVEQEAQRKVLEELGCVRAQGFLFSKPEPAERLTERLIAV